MASSSEPLAFASSGSESAGTATRPPERIGFVRSRKRFKVYTWKYKKTITPIASFILIVNQIFGFGMNAIPSIFAEGGLLSAVLANLVMWVMACLCSLMLLKAMTFLPHNNNFQHRIEYNSLVKYYLSDFYFKIVAFLHYVGDFCTVVCGIVTFSKLLDMLLIKAVGHTLMLQLHPSLGLGKVGPELFRYIYETTDSARPLGVMGVTLGYLVCSIICTRLSCGSLEETTRFHVTSFLILLGCSLQLCVHSAFSLKGQGWRAIVGRGGPVGAPTKFLGDGVGTEPPPRFASGLKGRVKSAAFRTGRFLHILLTFVDNYSVASTLPSWANEMTNEVRPTRTLWLSSFFAFAMYLVLGLLFSRSFLKPGSSSILDDILNSSHSLLVNCSISLFVIMTCIPDVVFGCISLRYNLLNLGYLTSTHSYFWGCVFPFLFTWLMVNDSLFQGLIGTLGLISALVCDFLVPVHLYIIAHTRDYSDFMRPREPDKLELLINRLVDLYKTVRRKAASIYRRTVRNKVLGPCKRFVNTKLLGAAHSGLHHSDLPAEVFKSDSSTTISSASDGSYNRGNTGSSTSSGASSSFPRASTADSSNFSTVSAYLSRDSFFFSRFARTRLGQTLSFSSFRRSISNFFGSRSSGFSNFSRGSSGSEQGYLSKQGSKLANTISSTFGIRFSNPFLNRSGRFSKTQPGTKSSELSDALSKAVSTNLSSFADDSSSERPHHLGSASSLAKGPSVTFSKGPSTVLNFEKYEAMDSQPPNTPVSGRSSCSATEQPVRTFSSALSTGLRNTSSLTKSLRKTISASFSKTLSKNFVETTPVEFGSSIEGFPGDSRSSSMDHEPVRSTVSSTSSIDDSANVRGVKDGTAGSPRSKPVNTSTEAGPIDPDNFIDYNSFKIIKRPMEPRKTDDNLFNAINKPCTINWPRPEDQQIAPRSRCSSLDDYKTCVSASVPEDSSGFSSSYADDRYLGGFMDRKGKGRRARDGKRHARHDPLSRDRLVVFPRCVHAFHLQIAKLMIVAITALTCVVPGLNRLLL